MRGTEVAKDEGTRGREGKEGDEGDNVGGGPGGGIECKWRSHRTRETDGHRGGKGNVSRWG